MAKEEDRLEIIELQAVLPESVYPFFNSSLKMKTQFVLGHQFEVRVLTIHTVEKPHITYRQPSVYAILSYPQIKPVVDCVVL